MYSTGSVTHLEPNPEVTHRLLQSTNTSINRSNINNNNPTGCREIHYIMLHVLATMVNLSSHLLRYDDVVSAHGDGNLVEDVHIFTTQRFQDLNYLSGMILMNIYNTRSVISSVDTCENLQQISQRLYQTMERLYKTMEQLIVYLEISDPDRILPSSNDGKLRDASYDLQRVKVTFNSPLHSSSNIQRFSKRSLFQSSPVKFQTTTTRGGTNTFPIMEIHIAHHSSSPTGNRPPKLSDPRHLIPSVAPHVYNRSMGLPFTAPIVSQSTPARVTHGPTLPMTEYSMSNTPARLRSSSNHALMNSVGNANQTIVMSDSIPILDNLHSLQLRKFIEIITSRAVDNNTALLYIDRRNRNLITLKLESNPMTMRANRNQRWIDEGNIPVVEVLQHLLS